MSPPNAGWHLEHTYAALPALFHLAARPVPVRGSKLVVFNRDLAGALGLDGLELERPESAAVFTGTVLPPGAQPLAQAYAGHQFGSFTTLGDGRAILLGEQITPDGRRFDVQLKGSGQTPFSRRGDGRAALGPMLREYLISEAMHALGIPTTRSLAVATTGEPVFRETSLPGAVLTRIAASHVRVGTFEWAAARGNRADLAALAEYTRKRHFPELEEAEQPHLALLAAVIERQAALIARWQLVGFVHGVMNTDNMALSGETIDYGPCAFLDVYHPAKVFSSIDSAGRYAYGRQPLIAHWNLTRLAESMLPLLHAEEERAIELAQAALDRFRERFDEHWLAGMRAKLGLGNAAADDSVLISDLLQWMHRTQADFTNTFAALSGVGEPPQVDSEFQAWWVRWRTRLTAQPLTAAESLALRRGRNPAVIPRNHQVEQALIAAVERDDFSILHDLLAVLVHPFEHDRAPVAYTLAPGPEGRDYRTYCGT